ncbi:MAG: CRISPR-associated protein Cas5 [Saprospiraceae bacterium]|nr:CRISPR-associated protein Cas5 [Saprospiraceae bacterium]
MNYCLIQVHTQTATFRNPEFQNFHKSFALPPPTTIVGLAGAALGLEAKEAQAFFEGRGFQMGVKGTSCGKANDLWKYRTLSSDPAKATSVLTREILYDNRFLIAFANENADLIEDLRVSFMVPTYAPVLGSSDSLAKIKVLPSDTFSETQSTELSHCLVGGNAVEDALAAALSNQPFNFYLQYNDSMFYDLPTRFHYETSGVRRVVERKPFTFIGTSMKLPAPIAGLTFDNQFVPLFSL